MSESANPSAPSATLVTSEPLDSRWAILVGQLKQWLEEAGVSPARAVVLVPYAQLMSGARRAWLQLYPNGFAPRFESSRNWAGNLMPFAPGPTDWSGDMARDSLVAAALVDRVAKDRADSPMRAAMAGRLVEAVRPLAALAAAVDPDHRVAWGQSQLTELAPSLLNPPLEGVVATLAVTWASTSSFATDVLWSDSAAPGRVADALVVLQGFQADPLSTALSLRWGSERSVVWSLFALATGSESMPAEKAVPAGWTLHACEDAEDEAQRATACVIRRINVGQIPVALLANDRSLTRRVSALLHIGGVGVRDETGWKLSTTHAAAQLVALLRASSPRASMDEVLDALKLAPEWGDEACGPLEQMARRLGVARWSVALKNEAIAKTIPPGWAELLAGLQAPRPLAGWLIGLREALEAGGWLAAFDTDPAGEQLMLALHMHPGGGAELSALSVDAGAQGVAESGKARLWPLAAFTSWANDVMESASFNPPVVGDADVVILPLAQQLGRNFASTVVPGCDERSLPTHPEPPPPWTPAQRASLGMPSRDELALAASLAWLSLAQRSDVDVLWRRQDRGEDVLPNAWVQAIDRSTLSATDDPRERRRVSPVEAVRPSPSAPGLLPERLSASAYQDLRDCPYRFFALRQLRLQDADELEGEPDQRDMGNWLHAVLLGFHEERGEQRPGREVDLASLERWATRTAEAMGLQTDKDGAGFLPFQAVWPAMRVGYLDWLYEHESAPWKVGPVFEAAEVEKTASVGRWRLLGKLDRIDAQASPEGPISMVMDYKTESRAKTLERVKNPLEDTQLAFYAVLLPEENLRAAYLSISDKRGGGRDAAVVLIEQTEILLAREALVSGVAHDLDRVASGHGMQALGEGVACEHCKARGLCRRDDWSAS